LPLLNRRKLAADFTLPQFNLLPRLELALVDLRSIFEVQPPYFSCAVFHGQFQPCLFIEMYHPRIPLAAIQHRQLRTKKFCVANQLEHKVKELDETSTTNEVERLGENKNE
jgi:hypothetical protein